MFKFPMSLGIKLDSANTGEGVKKGGNMGQNGAFGDIGGNHREEVAKRRKSSGNSRTRMSRGKTSMGESYEQDVEELNSDIASVMMPFNYSEIGESRNSDRIVRTFTLVIVTVPTIIAVAIPVLFPHAQANVDLASLITDGIMIILVSWFIKFTTEWPWKWMRQIKSTKRKLINHVNSTAIINKVSLGNLSDAKLNDEILEKNILLIKKLMNYEAMSMFFCLIGIMLGSLLMIWARNYIIVEEARKKIVFSNLNIGLYIFWGIFRLIMTFTDNIQRKSIGAINEGLTNPDFSEYKLITEENVNMYLPGNEGPSTPRRKQNSYTGNKADDETVQDESRFLSLKKIEDLEYKLEEQNRKILELTEDNKSQIVEISSSLTKLEDSVDTINQQKLGSPVAADRVFLKPFPLNLNIEGNKVYELQKEPMNTIFEEEGENELGGDSDRIFHNENGELHVPFYNKPLSSNSRATDILKPTLIEEESSKFFPKSTKSRENEHGNHFSLHGLPFSSSIKELITRQVYKDQNHKIPLNTSIRNLVDYESEIHNPSELPVEKKNEKDTNQAYVSLFSSVKVIVNTIRTQLSVTDIIKNPRNLKTVLIDEIAPTISQVTEENLEAYIRNIEIVKSLMWELAYKYVISNIDSLKTYFSLLDKKYLSSLRSGKKVVVIVFTKIPINIVRIQLNIFFFLPKILIKFFIISPIVVYKRETGLPEIKQEVPSRSFEGIKEFNLSSMDHNKYLQQFVEGNPSIKARRVLLNKLAKHCDIDGNFDDHQTTSPVALYGER